MQYKMFDCSRAGEMDIFIAEVFTRFVGMSKKKKYGNAETECIYIIHSMIV